MKVVLVQDIKKLGDANDIVEVKPGYARNYLFPQGLAVPATKAELNRVKTQAKAIQAEKERKLAVARETGAKLEGRTYEIVMTVGDEGRLYGSVTPMQVARLIAEDGFEGVDHRDVTFEETLRTVGQTKATVRLHTDVTATVNVVVKGENGETEIPKEASEEDSEVTEEAVEETEDVTEDEEETESTDEETSEDAE